MEISSMYQSRTQAWSKSSHRLGTDPHQQEGEVKRVTKCGDRVLAWLVFSKADFCFGWIKEIAQPGCHK